MKIIKIQSKVYGEKNVLVDYEDFDLVNMYKWSLLPSKNGETFYAKTNIKIDKGYTTIQMHTLILGSENIDHVDRNGLNNQRLNIRQCSHSENMMNKKKLKVTSSKYKGVNWYSKYGKWNARIGTNHKRKCLGYFNTEIEAAIAYNNAASKLHGEFANLNKI